MTATVLMISPGYPAEMPFFTRGLARAGRAVIGAGDQPVSALPEWPATTSPHYWQIPSFANEDAIVHEVVQRAAGIHIDHVASLWEPTMVLAARIREALGIPGMTVEQTIPFRDKERMKQVLDAAGIRTPHHYRCTTRPGSRSRRAHRLSDHRQADRRRRIGGHLPRRQRRRRSTTCSRKLAWRGRGERRGVRRGDGVHLRHHLRGRRGALRQHRAGTGRAR